MRHNFYRRTVFFTVITFISVSFISVSPGEEAAIPVATPVIIAKPVKNHDGIGKLLGKTMKMVSHKGVGIFPKFSKSAKSADKGAPEPVETKLFDAKTKESPIRTARLFKIQFNPMVAKPVN